MLRLSKRHLYSAAKCPFSKSKTFFVVKVHMAGQIHWQVKDLPHGTKVNKVTIGDR